LAHGLNALFIETRIREITINWLVVGTKRMIIMKVFHCSWHWVWVQFTKF